MAAHGAKTVVFFKTAMKAMVGDRDRRIAVKQG
jgi:hypothetical protein